MSSKFKSIKENDTIYVTPYETDKAVNGLTLKFEYKDLSISSYKCICHFINDHCKTNYKYGYIISDTPPEKYTKIDTFFCLENSAKALMIKQVSI
jgi:hypothetical protein